MSNWIYSLPWDDISDAAKKYNLDVKLVGAMVQTESSGNPWATRYEAHFRWTTRVHTWANTHGITSVTEEMGQKTSWGLMQIMGATARSVGFQGYFPELCDPYTGLNFSCKYLSRLVARYTKEDSAIAAYNAGSARYTGGGNYVNQKYVDKVRKYMREL